MAKPTARTALRVIREVAKAHDLTHDLPSKLGWGDPYNGTAVLTPRDWEDRGHDYATGRIAVVVYEGSDLSMFFNLDACYRTGAASDYDTWEAMHAALGEAGMWAEAINGYSSSIYRSEDA